MFRYILALCLPFLFTFQIAFASPKLVVFQSDFGLKDGAVSAMKGVALGVDDDLKLYDLTHEIPAYNVWEAAYRLYQTVEYWPQGTVFVSIVDPGVGTDRGSVVMKSKQGHYFVTPDNGTLTLVADKFGIDAIRQIDEAINRRENSEKSYTFHGRDVYAYTAARLAAGVIGFEQVGKLLPPQIQQINYQQAEAKEGMVYGNIPILDVQYGNVWTNIHRQVAQSLSFKKGSFYQVEIYHNNDLIVNEKIPFANSFGDVKEGENLIYFNSLDNLSIAINMGDFAQTHRVASGPNWKVRITRL